MTKAKFKLDHLRGVAWSFRAAWPVFYFWAKGGVFANDEKWLDPSDALIICYIMALENSKSKKVVYLRNGRGFVWVDYQTLLKKVPLLDFSLSMLGKRLKKLCDLGILMKEKRRDISNRTGFITKVYYKTTSFFDETEDEIGVIIANYLEKKSKKKRKKCA